MREHETGSHSVLLVNTVDRPGLLTGVAWEPRNARPQKGWCSQEPWLLPPRQLWCLTACPDAHAKVLQQVCHYPLALPSLPDIVRVLKDINLNVVSAEVDTIGRNAFDRFNVT